MIIKIIVVILFVLVIASLGSALFGLLTSDGSNNRTVRALTFRIGLSILLFALLIVSAKMGWIQPHGL